MEIAERDCTVGILDCEVGGCGANARRPGAAITAAEQKCENDQGNRGASHKAIIPNSAYDGARSSIEEAVGVGDRAGAQ
jgi:hypothetical protein